MRSYLPFVMESSVAFLIIFVFITQLIVPLWIDLPVFWIFRKHGRGEANRRFRKLIGAQPPKPKGPRLSRARQQQANPPGAEQQQQQQQ